MKKLWILILSCLLLCACGKEPSPPLLAASDCTATLAFTLGETGFTANYTRLGDTETVVFSAPATLAGMTVTLCGDVCTVTVGEKGFTDLAAERAVAFTRLLAPPSSTLRLVSETDGVYCFSGRDGEDLYTVCTDADGLPLRAFGRLDGREYDLQILRYQKE